MTQIAGSADGAAKIPTFKFEWPAEVTAAINRFAKARATVIRAREGYAQIGGRIAEAESRLADLTTRANADAGAAVASAAMGLSADTSGASAFETSRAEIVGIEAEIASLTAAKEQAPILFQPLVDELAKTADEARAALNANLGPLKDYSDALASFAKAMTAASEYVANLLRGSSFRWVRPDMVADLVAPTIADDICDWRRAFENLEVETKPLAPPKADNVHEIAAAYQRRAGEVAQQNREAAQAWAEERDRKAADAHAAESQRALRQ